MIERRSKVRSTSPDFARLLMPGNFDRPCRVLDRSSEGMRIAVHGSPRLPAHFEVEMFWSGEVVSVQIAWQRPNEVGLSIGSIEA